MNILTSVKKLISLFLLVCFISTFLSCHTTNNVYENKEIIGNYKFVSANILSHQNNMGVLYYTVEPYYISLETGQQLNLNDLDTDALVKFNVDTNRNFPYSTYSDAVLYMENNSFPEEIIINSTKNELVRSERVFSPVKTGLAIGLPILGVLMLIVSSIISPPEDDNKK